MTERLTERLQALQAEYEAGQKLLADLDAKRANLTSTMLRIEGAIQVLNELIRSADAEPADAARTGAAIRLA